MKLWYEWPAGIQWHLTINEEGRRWRGNYKTTNAHTHASTKGTHEENREKESEGTWPGVVKCVSQAYSIFVAKSRWRHPIGSFVVARFTLAMAEDTCSFLPPPPVAPANSRIDTKNRLNKKKILLQHGSELAMTAIIGHSVWTPITLNSE